LLVIADGRYGASEAFAQGLRPCGARRFDLADDVADLWFDALKPALVEGHGAITGLTLESELFVLRRLAASSASLRYLGTHDWRLGGQVRHTLRGELRLEPLAAALNAAAEGWATRLAEALASARLTAWQSQEVRAERAISSGRPRFFVSWLLTACGAREA
jgi:hypothetical protein